MKAPALIQERMMTVGPSVYTVSFRNAGRSPFGERQDAAVGMVAEIGAPGKRVRNDFDRVSFFDRPICNATWDSAAKQWTDIVWQGEERFSFEPTEPKREVLYLCRPFYYRLELDALGSPEVISVCASPLPGFSLAPIFRDGKTPVFRPCFEMGLGWDALPHSRANYPCLHERAGMLIADLQSYDANAYTERAADRFSDLLLLWVEFATRDLHRVMHGATRDTVTVSGFRYLPDRSTAEHSVVLAPEGADLTALRLYTEVEVCGDTGGETVGLNLWIDGIEQTERGSEIGLSWGLAESLLDRDEAGAYTETVSLMTQGFITGTVLPHLTSSSGVLTTPDDPYSTCSWRGKENPWGNFPMLLCDLAVKPGSADGVRYARYHVLESLRDWSSNANTGWVELTDFRGGAAGFVEGLYAYPDRPWLLCPTATGNSADGDYGAYLQLSTRGMLYAVYYGGYHQIEASLNPVSLQTASINAIIKYSCGRLVLYEEV